MSVSMSLMRAPKEKQEVEIEPEINSLPQSKCTSLYRRLLCKVNLKYLSKYIGNSSQLIQAKKGEACPGCNVLSEAMTGYQLLYDGEEITVPICTDCNKTPNEQIDND